MPPLYRTKPFATNGDKRAADAFGQGTATVAYGVTQPFTSMILRAASEAKADAPGGQGRRVRGGQYSSRPN